MQQEVKWRYYNHAIVPTTAPHETVDASVLSDRSLWRSLGGFPVLARWTTDFDSEEYSGWWFEIKDAPFAYEDLRGKYRTKIKRGLKDYNIRVIDPTQYAEELFEVLLAAIASYSAKCRMRAEHDEFVENLKNWRSGETFAAFSKEDNELAAYMYVTSNDSYFTLSVLKANPSHERNQVNAAVVYSVLEHYKEQIAGGMYVLAGERNILHDTNCHEYLEKYFGFRKAYCRLNIRYRWGLKPIISCLFPIRGVFENLKRIKLFCLIGSVLKMEAIARSGKDLYPCTCNAKKD